MAERIGPGTKSATGGEIDFDSNNVTSINTTATVNTTGGAVPIGTITTQPTFLPTSTLLEARILQFGLKIDF